MADSDMVELPSMLTPAELERRVDYDWALRSPEVLREYYRQVVAVHGRVVLGAGKKHSEAMARARQHPSCPAEEKDIVLVPIGF